MGQLLDDYLAIAHAFLDLLDLVFYNVLIPSLLSKLVYLRFVIFNVLLDQLFEVQGFELRMDFVFVNMGKQVLPVSFSEALVAQNQHHLHVVDVEQVDRVDAGHAQLVDEGVLLEDVHQLDDPLLGGCHLY